MNTLQQSETNLPITCPFPKNIIQTLLISANLQFHPSFFNLSYPKNYCQKYYLYRMINHMVYTPHQLNYSNIQVPSQLLFFRRYSIYLSDLELIHQSPKLLKITPVSDDDTDANTNRPISLLSNFNRVLQKIIYSRLTSYIKKHELLYSSQHGFRKGHSTQHVILDIVHDIQTNMNQRLLSCGVFIDHKKPSTQSITTFCLIGSITMAFVNNASRPSYIRQSCRWMWCSSRINSWTIAFLAICQ